MGDGAVDLSRQAVLENRLRVLENSAVLGLVYCNADGLIVDANETFLRMIGYARAELEQNRLNWRDITPEEFQSLSQSMLDQVAATGSSKSFDKQYLRRDGSAIWVNVLLAALNEDQRQFLKLVTDITERKSAEEALITPSKVLDSMAEGVSLSDENGYIVYANPAEETMFGYEPGGLIGRHVTEQNTYEPAENDSIVARIFKELEGQGYWEGEFSNRKKDGTPFITYARINALDVGGKKRFLCVQQDVTRQKRLEQAQRFLTIASLELAKSLDYETTLRSIADQAVPELGDWCAIDILMDDGSLDRIAVAHVDPAKVQWAREIQQKYPVDMDAAQGVPNVLRTGQPELYPIVDGAMLEASAKDEEHLRMIREVQIGSAMIVPLRSRGTPVGALAFVSALEGRYGAEELKLAEELAIRASLALENSRLYRAAQREITERERTESELRASEERYRALANSMPLIVWVQSADRGLEFINDHFIKYTGVSRETPQADLWTHVVHPDDLRSSQDHYVETYSRGLPWEQELRLRSADGAYRWHLSRLIPIADVTGEVVRWIGTSTDVHDLRELRTRLEARVRERTTELERAYAELESFSYSVSHDLRAPLRAINMAASILAEDHIQTLGKEALGELSEIKRTVVAMGGLIDDLLQYAQLSRAQVQQTEIDLSKVAAEVADVLNHSYPTIEFRIQAGLKARGDTRLVRTLLENLMENASKYARMESPYVELSQEEEAFVVRDNGIGFEQEYAERIFAPFERLHREDSYEGTGIGLANVKRIVERHCGRVWAESSPGEGSAFYFTLQ